MPEPGVVAIIFAGGVGTRMNGHGTPKQFMEVDGKPILIHTCEHFEHHPQVDGIYLACLVDYIDQARQLGETFGISKLCGITPGGLSAQMSILSALRMARDDGVPEGATALIHDGVRPVINQELISRNIESVRRHGSGITAIPCFETIARSLDGARTIDCVTQRDLMYVLQAPQSFRLGEILRVNERSVADSLAGRFVDQADLMHHYGRPLHMVEGFRGNVKITTGFDFLQFRLLMDSSEYAAVIGRE
jgi:D-ribitol-5-phosphate cytidylyltransferase